MKEAVLIILFAFLSFCYIYWKALLFEYGYHTCSFEKKTTPSYKILTVKNNEDRIEGVIYSLIKEMHSTQNNSSMTNIIVIDFDSCDNTIKILEKLSKKYDFIQVLHSDSYIDMVGRI